MFLDPRTLFRQRRRDQADADHRADITTRRNAINACNLCDELGWLHVTRDTPTTRCNHDPSTGGW